MDILYGYLKKYWTLVALALVLATINQVFSFLDPLIFRHIIDEYATRYKDYTTSQFIRGVSLLIGAAVAVASCPESPRTSRIISSTSSFSGLAPRCTRTAFVIR